MTVIGSYSFDALSRQSALIHVASLEAASSLENQDKTDFGKDNVSENDGTRYTKIEIEIKGPELSCHQSIQTSCSGSDGTARTIYLGITAKKIQYFQTLELAYEVAKANDRSLDKISDLFQQVSLKRFHKRSATVAGDSQHSVKDNTDYLTHEKTVENEWNRLINRNREMKGESVSYLENEILLNSAVQKAAQSLLQAEQNNIAANGKYLVAADSTLATSVLAAKYFSK